MILRVEQFTVSIFILLLLRMGPRSFWDLPLGPFPFLLLLITWAVSTYRLFHGASYDSLVLFTEACQSLLTASPSISSLLLLGTASATWSLRIKLSRSNCMRSVESCKSPRRHCPAPQLHPRRLYASSCRLRLDCPRPRTGRQLSSKQGRDG